MLVRTIIYISQNSTFLSFFFYFYCQIVFCLENNFNWISWSFLSYLLLLWRLPDCDCCYFVSYLDHVYCEFECGKLTEIEQNLFISLLLSKEEIQWSARITPNQ